MAEVAIASMECHLHDTRRLGACYQGSEQCAHTKAPTFDFDVLQKRIDKSVSNSLVLAKTRLWVSTEIGPGLTRQWTW